MHYNFVDIFPNCQKPHITRKLIRSLKVYSEKLVSHFARDFPALLLIVLY